MESSAIALLSGIIITALISLIAMFLVLRQPRGEVRSMALMLMAVFLATSVMYIVSAMWPVNSAALVFGIPPNVLEIWATAITFRLVVALSPWKERFSGNPALVTALYAPALALTLAVAGAWALDPSVFAVKWGTGLPFVDVGFLNPVFFATGFFYVLLVVGAAAIIALYGSREYRTELWLIAVFTFLVGMTFPVTMFLAPGISPSAMALIFISLIGLTISYAALSKRIFVVPRSEERTVESPIDLLRPGGTYIFLREKQQARELFVLYLKTGRQGLWITRRPPRESRELYGLDKTPFIWLTSSTVPGENCVDPGEFGPLSTAISNFTREARDYLILVEGVEYIVSKTGFPTVLKLVQYLNDRVMSTGGMLLLGMDPQAFKEGELALLKSEAAGVFEDEDIRSPSLGRPEAGRPAEAALAGHAHSQR